MQLDRVGAGWQSGGIGPAAGGTRLHQCQLQGLGRDGLGRLGVQRLQQRQRTAGGVGLTIDAKHRAAAGYLHRQRCLDRPQVLVKSATQLRQALVVGGLKIVAKNHCRGGAKARIWVV